MNIIRRLLLKNKLVKIKLSDVNKGIVNFDEDLLFLAIKSNDFYIRKSIAQALGKEDHIHNIKFLRILLEDSSRIICQIATKSLEKLCTKTVFEKNKGLKEDLTKSKNRISAMIEQEKKDFKNFQKSLKNTSKKDSSNNAWTRERYEWGSSSDGFGADFIGGADLF